MPAGDFVVETKLSNNLAENVANNSIESGIVLYQDDTHFLKLTMQAIGSTRQLEFAIKNGGTWGRAYLAAAARRPGCASRATERSAPPLLA
jgi:hypothetical protein